MIVLLLSLFAQQPQQPALEADIHADADQIAVGGEVVLTIRARSVSPDPIQIQLPPFAGLELVARSERSEVAAGQGISRTTVLDLRLRGSTPGKWRLGPARVRQGNVTVETDPIMVEVTGIAGGVTAAAPSLSARVEKLLAQSRPPRSGDQASVSIILSAGSAYIGEQVDIVTAAWFPRELRLQLRRPPTVQTPSVDGVYSYPQRSPSGIAASRQVGGRWFDLFVVHQIVFPLTPGRLRVPPATLHYSVPLAFQFFSQEERYAVQSDPKFLEVRPLPTSGQPAGFSGGVGRGITVERLMSPRSGRAGEPFTMDVVIHGEGNVALWPPPALTWPAHLRAYSERVDDKIDINAGNMGGTKTFRYLVIPDSARTAGLPAVAYPYFDPVSAAYTTAVSPAVSYRIDPARDVAVSRASAAPLKLQLRPLLAKRLVAEVPTWALLGIVLLPPLLALGVAIPQRRPGSPRIATGPVEPLAEAEQELNAALADLVPQLADLEGPRLEAALHAVGVETTAARHAVQLRDRIRGARYGPPGSSERKELMVEVDAIVERMRGQSVRHRPRRSISVTAVGVALLVGSPLRSQSLPPEQLYEQGALSAAAAAFAQRAALEPDVPAHWFNLGATRFRMGEAGAALASWKRAERLAPRDPAIRRALRLVPVPDTRSARALWVSPATPEELWVLAAIFWIVGWVGYALARRQRWGVLIGAALLAAGLGGALTLWYSRPLAVVLTEQSLALSPNDLAPAVSPVQVGSVVSEIKRLHGWVMVRDSGGKIGWLPSEIIERL